MFLRSVNLFGVCSPTLSTSKKTEEREQIERERERERERDGEGAVIHARSKDSVLARPALAVQRITDVGYIGNIVSLLRAQTTSVSGDRKG